MHHKRSILQTEQQGNFWNGVKLLGFAMSYKNVAIGNPELHMRKASHRGSKQQ